MLAALSQGAAFQGAILILVAAIFFAGARLAFYHVGVEQHWFAGPSACTGAVIECLVGRGVAAAMLRRASR